ncbi:MAG: hypothetical protein GKS07_06000 [Nitrosopumilus sp.]|nr:MAG: hypothetical protein GKS07_06000 [Nitrosopumilus sp.]
MIELIIIGISIVISAIIGRQAIRHSEKLHVSTNRPWIVSHNLDGEPSSVKIKFDSEKTIRFRFKNVGNSSAMDISIQGYIIGGKNGNDKEITHEQMKKFYVPLEPTFGDLGPSEWNIIIADCSDMMKNSVDTFNGKSVDSIIKKNGDDFYFGFIINYKSSLEKTNHYYHVHAKAEWDENEEESALKYHRKVLKVEIDSNHRM